VQPAIKKALKSRYSLGARAEIKEIRDRGIKKREQADIALNRR